MEVLHIEKIVGFPDHTNASGPQGNDNPLNPKTKTFNLRLLLLRLCLHVLQQTVFLIFWH